MLLLVESLLTVASRGGVLAKGGWDEFTVLYAEHCVIAKFSSAVVSWLDLEAELWVKLIGLTAANGFEFFVRCYLSM